MQVQPAAFFRTALPIDLDALARVELAESGRNTGWSISNGGREVRPRALSAMVAMHALLRLTAMVFSAANAAMLNERIRTENTALGYP